MIKLSNELKERIDNNIAKKRSAKEGLVLAMKYFEEAIVAAELEMEGIWEDIEVEANIDISLANYTLDKVLGEVWVKNAKS